MNELNARFNIKIISVPALRELLSSNLEDYINRESGRAEVDWAGLLQIMRSDAHPLSARVRSALEIVPILSDDEAEEIFKKTVPVGNYGADSPDRSINAE